jgi:MFS family permease
MHFDTSPAPLPADGQPWYHGMTRYHWFVLVVAALGWMADCMDQQLFNLARRPAIIELLQSPSGERPPNSTIEEYSGYATSIFLIGWGTGGLLFGLVGDLIGRAKTMMLTILMYAGFTGLSALSVNFWQFGLFRFLTGMGVGGEFAVGVALVAEVMPDHSRPFALGLLQALSAIGNITAAVIGIVMGQMAQHGLIGSPWRAMFVIGTFPALLVVAIRRRLRDPERWQKAASQGGLLQRFQAYYAEIFRDPRWTRHALVGLVLASSGIIGLWSIGFFSIDLQRSIFEKQLAAEGLSEQQLVGRKELWASLTSIMLNLGAALGIYAFSMVTHRLGRKPTFAISFILALVSTVLVFWTFNSLSDIFWMIPLMGFCQLSLFGGYAIYFPELFPTRLRSSGTSVCYNGARFVAAAGPTALGWLTGHVYANTSEPLRYAGMTMCVIFLVGLLALPFAPETRGQPLPE